MLATTQNVTDPGVGLMAAGYGFVIFVLVFVAISAFSEWIKKRSQKGSTDSFDPGGFNSRKSKSAAADREAKPLSGWEEEIRRMLQGEQSPPPPVPRPLARPAPPPLPGSWDDPLIYETEGRSDEPVPTHLSSMEPPDSAFKRGSQVDRRAQAMVAAAGNHPDSDAVLARVDRIDDSVAARMAAAGTIHIGRSMNPTAGPTPASREDLVALVKALRSPIHARGAMVASIILGPPKALER